MQRERLQERQFCPITLIGEVSAGKSQLIHALQDNLDADTVNMGYEGLKHAVLGHDNTAYTVIFIAEPAKYWSGWEA